MLRRIVTAAAFASLALVAACNTVEGAGQDIESVGEEIDEEL